MDARTTRTHVDSAINAAGMLHDSTVSKYRSRYPVGQCGRARGPHFVFHARGTESLKTSPSPSPYPPGVMMRYSLNADSFDVNCPAETDSANRAKSR